MALIAATAVAAIERACARLVLRSIRAFDERDWQGYASLFTQDGVFIRANAPGEPLTGREAIRVALAARSASRLTRHFCTNIEIDVLDARHARGLCYLLLYAGDASLPESVAGRPADGVQRVGEYRDTFVRTEDGWRIGRREGRLVFSQ
ncbi:MAG: nuclear transport factor 2 family protein [Steroidobacteraceae bacterium]